MNALPSLVHLTTFALMTRYPNKKLRRDSDVDALTAYLLDAT